MKVLIVDDEPAMLLAMKRMLSNMQDVEIVGSFQNAAEALDFVKNREVDLAFLDIQIRYGQWIRACTQLDLSL